jgi:hypothetical protein
VGWGLAIVPSQPQIAKAATLIHPASAAGGNTLAAREQQPQTQGDKRRRYPTSR